jgi:hypothetical protein
MRTLGGNVQISGNGSTALVLEYTMYGEPFITILVVQSKAGMPKVRNIHRRGNGFPRISLSSCMLWRRTGRHRQTGSLRRSSHSLSVLTHLWEDKRYGISLNLGRVRSEKLDYQESSLTSRSAPPPREIRSLIGASFWLCQQSPFRNNRHRPTTGRRKRKRKPEYLDSGAFDTTWYQEILQSCPSIHYWRFEA